ncbi:hypothetical protein D9619_011429 [Psilocybe cf. subviscida]|uniref:Uncharacterized protein n=1 Tax=Psilocybe cf. subviscida TaxID=2480587 RepID=A0A8H5F567_9AGAR|nr:hypothetical protein D9619_011429 [Psilocybe cf. subviscida]
MNLRTTQVPRSTEVRTASHRPQEVSSYCITLVFTFDYDIRKAVFAAHPQSTASLRPLLYPAAARHRLHPLQWPPSRSLRYPHIAAFLQSEILIPLTDQERESNSCITGLDGLASGRFAPPSVAHLESVSASFLLFSLTQVVQHLKCHIPIFTPGELRIHSHRSVPAIDIGASACYFRCNSFDPTAWAHPPWLPRQIFSVFEPGAFQNAIEEAISTPGGTWTHIASNSKYLPTTSQLFVSLDIGLRAFIVTGPPMHGLVSNGQPLHSQSANGSTSTSLATPSTWSAWIIPITSLGLSSATSSTVVATTHTDDYKDQQRFPSLHAVQEDALSPPYPPSVGDRPWPQADSCHPE